MADTYECFKVDVADHVATVTLARPPVNAQNGRFREEIVDYGALRGGLNWYRAMPFAVQLPLHGKVSVPTTLVWSDGDVAVTRIPVDRCAAYVEGPYELRVLEGVTHWIPTQAPEAVADAVLSRIASVV